MSANLLVLCALGLLRSRAHQPSCLCPGHACVFVGAFPVFDG